MWDTQEEIKTNPAIPDVNGTSNVLQPTASLALISSNASSVSSLLNASSTTVAPTASSVVVPQMQHNQQSQLSLSLPNSLLQSSQIMPATSSNSSTTTLASTATQNVINNNNLSHSLGSNELNARFDMWAECLAELFVYKNILKCPLTRTEAWRMIFFSSHAIISLC